MKKYILCLAMSLFAYSFSEEPSMEVRNIFSITAEEKDLLAQGNASDIILEIPAGGKLPLQYSLSGDLSVEQGVKQMLGQMYIDKPIYVRIVEGDLLFSSDLQQWKTFLDFFAGSISLGLSIDENGPVCCFDLSVNHRS